jgi:hypothetical protein
MYARNTLAAAILFAVFHATTATAQPQTTQPPPTAQPAQPTAQQPQPTGQQPPPTGAQQPQPTSQPQPQAVPNQPVGTTGQVSTTPGQTTGAMTGQQPMPIPPNPACSADISMALPLLDRVQRLLDEAIKDNLGKVSLDRGNIDEMRAEIAQVRAAIAPPKQQ